jgi:hypothetical protein
MRQNNNQSGNGEDTRHLSEEEQELDGLIARAVQAAAKGENVEQVLEVMLSSLPASLKEKTRKKFAAALAKRGLRQPSGDPDIVPRATLSRIRIALQVTTRQMIERIMQLLRARPEIAEHVRQAGQALVRHGVAADRVVPMSEAELGAIAPSAVSAGRAQGDRARNT